MNMCCENFNIDWKFCPHCGTKREENLNPPEAVNWGVFNNLPADSRMTTLIYEDRVMLYINNECRRVLYRMKKTSVE